jgi:hypothetical protein
MTFLQGLVTATHKGTSPTREGSGTPEIGFPDYGHLLGCTP